MESPDSPDGKELEVTFQQARDAALRFLGYRARSEAEVRRRLLLSYPTDLVEQVISSLKAQQFLDDQAFAQRWRQDREQYRPRAQRLIRQELLRRGVHSETVQTVLEDFDNGANAYQAGAKLAQRLAARDYPEEELRRKLWAHLRQRGFTYGEINDAVERLWRELGPDLLHRQRNSNDEEE